jgi:hydrogenase nickel incorporation protein HypA/HybF
MHELPVTESILNIVLRHAAANQVQAVVSIGLRVGEMSDLEDEWIQRYFDYLSKGTLAEGARLKIERVPVTIECPGCKSTYTVNIREEKDPRCPHCAATGGTMIAGREYYIKDMEVR